jgi:hypothetical protein
MRKEIYEAVMARLTAMGEIAWVDLWNQNVEFIEQETAWPTPAVFVEFDPISWSRTKEREMETRGALRLHVVTQWSGSASSESAEREASLAVFGLLDRIREQLEGLSGARFGRLQLQESLTNHNHEELLESIEVYSYRGRVKI